MSIISVFCYSARTHYVDKKTSDEPTCAAKDGNPFGAFWDTFEVEFDKNVFYGPLTYDSYNPHEIQRWLKRYIQLTSNISFNMNSEFDRDVQRCQ